MGKPLAMNYKIIFPGTKTQTSEKPPQVIVAVVLPQTYPLSEDFRIKNFCHAKIETGNRRRDMMKLRLDRTALLSLFSDNYKVEMSF